MGATGAHQLPPPYDKGASTKPIDPKLWQAFKHYLAVAGLCAVSMAIGVGIGKIL